jgi:hypothetical protein
MTVDRVEIDLNHIEGDRHDHGPLIRTATITRGAPVDYSAGCRRLGDLDRCARGVR